MAKVNFLEGTLSQYNNLATKDPNTLYFITDAQRIYKGYINVTDDIVYAATQDQLPTIENAIEGKFYLVLSTFEIRVKSASAWVILSPGYLTDGVDWVDADSNKFATIGLIKKGLAQAISSITTEVSYENGTVTVNGESVALTGLVNSISYDESALTITISSIGGTSPQVINLPKDNFVKSGRYEADYELPDGTRGPAIVLLVGSESGDSEVVIPAASLVDIYTADNEGKDITVTITDDKKISATAVINPALDNALVSDTSGLLVKLYSNENALEGSKIVFSDSTGKKITESAYTIKATGDMGNSSESIPTAALIAQAISSAVSAAQGTLQTAIESLTTRVDSAESSIADIISKLVGSGDADKVVISTSEGITRSDKIIGGASLDDDSSTRITKVATEQAVYNAMSWSTI